MNQPNIELIDNYLKGNLSDNAAQEFEHRLETDTTFAASVALQKDVVSGIESHFDTQLKEKLQHVENEFTKDEKETKVIPLRNWKPLAIAASVVLIVAFSYLKFFNTPNTQDVYLSYYEPYPNIVSPSERSAESQKQDAMSFYEKGDYETAASLFITDLKTSPNSDYIQFYMALSQLSLKNAKDAIPLLKNLANQDNSKFQAPAAWYLALSYTQAGDSNSAKKQLQSIIAGEGDYAKRAEKLLVELE